jgi:hypothetical protein
MPKPTPKRKIARGANSARGSVASAKVAAKAVPSRTIDSKPIATARKLVWFNVENVSSEALLAFLRWQRETGISPIESRSLQQTFTARGHVVADSFAISAGFYPIDADAVTDWLELQGIPVRRQ